MDIQSLLFVVGQDYISCVFFPIIDVNESNDRSHFLKIHKRFSGASRRLGGEAAA